MAKPRRAEPTIRVLDESEDGMDRHVAYLTLDGSVAITSEYRRDGDGDRWRVWQDTGVSLSPDAVAKLRDLLNSEASRG